MIRCVICDVYRTILRVGPARPEAVRFWSSAWRETFPERAAPDLPSLDDRCRELVAEDHAAAIACGVSFPEVQWPSILAKALASGPLTADFVYKHAQAIRSVALEPGFVDFASECCESGVVLGIVSNAQAYTLRELDDALAGAHTVLFASDLSFWSFQNGFSKPSPFVFRWLTARLAQRGIGPEEAIVVGDRLDNDIEPAQAAGMQTWHYRPSEKAGWPELHAWLRGMV
ncbi:MAG: HAD family hydrolase [Terrimicrobiaceae bacterium]|nr:HAD family hydrolase [Terrimicrobiaceae bacterium]